MTGLDLSELIELAALLIVTGALSGFLAGLFGIGGGAILVPVFYECFRLAGVPVEVRMPLCVGTSLAVIIPTAIRSCPDVRGRLKLLSCDRRQPFCAQPVVRALRLGRTKAASGKARHLSPSAAPR